MADVKILLKSLFEALYYTYFSETMREKERGRESEKENGQLVA